MNSHSLVLTDVHDVDVVYLLHNYNIQLLWFNNYFIMGV